MSRAHKIVVFIKGSPQRLEAFRKLTINPEFAPSQDDQDDALAFLDEAAVEPSAINLTMAPPPRPTDPTEPQTGDIQGGLSVKMANQTRWNSDEAEISRLLKLKKAVDYFLIIKANEMDEDCPQPLSPQDWRVLEAVRDFLRPFLFHTKHHEGNQVAIHDVLSSLWDLEQHTRLWLQKFGGEEIHAQDEILDEIVVTPRPDPPSPPQGRPQSQARELSASPSTRRGTRSQARIPTASPAPATSRRGRSRSQARKPSATTQETPRRQADTPSQQQPQDEGCEYKGADFMRTSLRHAFVLLDKYTKLLRMCPVYVAATILHPKYRLGGIKQAAPGFLNEAEQQFKAFFKKYWASEARSPSPPPSESSPFSANPTEWRTAFMERSPTPEAEGQRLSPDAEFDKYLKMKITREKDNKGRPIAIDPLRWWRDHKTAFPLLSQMAIDVLSIPAMSAACERVFSQGKLTITSQRHCMRAATLELLLCLKDWLRNGTLAGPAAEMATSERSSYLPN